jgi:DNA invertase Pin-like site-specific DNA recombinase
MTKYYKASPPGDMRAATYVRMSTESQNYSTDHQRAKIGDYAASVGMKIVREYADEGKSGLDLKGRAGLLALINDVQSGSADYSAIIVYDVSRWGRFQDVDEAAYHEHTCRRAGIQVVYCAEQFHNDGSPLASLLKSIKRTMAAEYSRELSVKVFDAQCRFIRMGFKQGGHAGYGLRRLAISEDGVPRRTLEYGEAKGSITDRVVLVLGPNHEVDTVKRVYALYVDDCLSEAAIARLLNAENLISETGRPWTQTMINSILTNLKYCGALVYNRRSCKLSSRREHNARQDWIINDGAFPRMLSPGLFSRAQVERARRNRRYTKAELVDLLRMCHSAYGKVTADIITADRSMPDPQLFVRCFGSLVGAYDEAGLPRTPLQRFVDTKLLLLAKRRVLFAKVRSFATAAGATVVQDPIPFTLVINDNLRVFIEIATRRNPKRGLPSWKVNYRAEVDFTIVARLDPSTKEPLDYFLFSPTWLEGGSIYLKDSNLHRFESIRFRSIEAIFGLPSMEAPTGITGQETGMSGRDSHLCKVSGLFARP